MGDAGRGDQAGGGVDGGEWVGEGGVFYLSGRDNGGEGDDKVR